MRKYEVATKVEGKELGISQKNIDIYFKYLQSCAIKSQDTVNTTYKTYFDNMKLFFQYLKEFEGNRYILYVQQIHKKTLQIFGRDIAVIVLVEGIAGLQ